MLQVIDGAHYTIYLPARYTEPFETVNIVDPSFSYSASYHCVAAVVTSNLALEQVNFLRR